MSSHRAGVRRLSGHLQHQHPLWTQLLHLRSSSLLLCLEKQQQATQVLRPLLTLVGGLSGVIGSYFCWPTPGPWVHFGCLPVDRRFVCVCLSRSFSLCNSAFFLINKICILKRYHYSRKWTNIITFKIYAADCHFYPCPQLMYISFRSQMYDQNNSLKCRKYS